MKVIGLTGGVGCGKSTVTDFLKNKYNAHVIQCDVLGHEVLYPSGEAYEPVIQLLGKDILDQSGFIDRAKVAGIVFKDASLLKKMNEIIHPAVIREVERQIVVQRALGNCEYVVMETALMIEAGMAGCCDVVWYVYADEAIRKARLKASRGYSDERIESVMASQKSEQEFRSIADFVIDNSGSTAETEKQIIQVLS